ncbi:hypothetical protein E2C01_071832 [Portunus trituberculatus]|uniref:Uncharacterized protein n=1 Tax=Portunus trituberculatus TaxID=210409 RepID=A0A5B7HY24_PORTR|nr:hypothetical protein [Portunus trituberculatus]
MDNASKHCLADCNQRTMSGVFVVCLNLPVDAAVQEKKEEEKKEEEEEEEERKWFECCLWI